MSLYSSKMLIYRIVCVDGILCEIKHPFVRTTLIKNCLLFNLSLERKKSFCFTALHEFHHVTVSLSRLLLLRLFLITNQIKGTKKKTQPLIGNV